MFFWFTNDTFSIIDALLKLILVITGSALIICFCHKLTNYKKTRRYKSPSPLQQVLDNRHQQLTLLNGTTTTGQFGVHPSQQQHHQLAAVAATANSHHLLAYDPYNSQLRQFACPTTLTDQNQHLLARNLDSSNSAYSFQSAAALIDSLAASELIRGASNNNNDINLISNPVYSSSSHTASPFQQIPLDCSFQSREITSSSNNDNQDQTNDQCPSYEEAIAAGRCQLEPTNPNDEAANDESRGETTQQRQSCSESDDQNDDHARDDGSPPEDD